MVAHIDGGSRGNPGPSSVGIVIEDSTTHLKIEISRYIGEKTNNQAEYHALIEALTLAALLKSPNIAIISDSELVVRQMQGRYTCKNEKLIPLHKAAKILADSFDVFGIVHVRREKNQEADRLANEALDRFEGLDAI